MLQEGSSIIKLWVRLAPMHCCAPAAAPRHALLRAPVGFAATGARTHARTHARTPRLCAVQDANQNLDTDLDTGMKDLTLISWSAVGPQLAIGNAKGDLVIYNKQQLKKQLIRGKHTKKITCGAWNSENKLALGSEDRQVAGAPHTLAAHAAALHTLAPHAAALHASCTRARARGGT